MLKIKIKATGQIIEVKDFSRIIIDEENEEIRELSLNEKRGDMIISIDFGHKDDITVETTFRKDKSGLTILSQRDILKSL